jgi:hypothetical protein
MTFEDLPADWPRRPVTDPAITADLLDLVIGDRDRAAGALGILLCGRDDRLLQPIVVEAPDLRAGAAERRRGFDGICGALGHLSEAGGDGVVLRPKLLVAVARPGPGLATAADRRWRDTAEQSCRDYGVGLLGVWLVTPNVIRPLPGRTAQRRSA